jgi:O-antigen ligase
MSDIPSNFFDKPRAPHVLLCALLALCGTVDFLRFINKDGGITGLGALTILGCGAAWGLWLARPYLPHDLLKPLLPLIMFEFYAVGSLLWYSASGSALELLAVGMAFLGLILLTARETDRDPALAERLHRVLLISSGFAVGVYLFAALFAGPSLDWMNNARAFALYAMAPVAVAVARWRAGRTRCLIWAGIIVLAVFLSLSRTALVACLLLFPLGIALRGDRKSVVLAGLILAGGAAAFSVAVMTYQPLYKRFFSYDVSMKIGDVTVNASGRTRMWGAVLDDLGDDWVFGKGISSSSALIEKVFPGMGHPHNDFLRYYYDLGIVGLGLWLCFMGGFIARAADNLRRSIRHRTGDGSLHVAALLALTAVSGSMFTDNSVSYSFVMMPLAILLGCSLGAGRAAMRERESAPVRVAEITRPADPPWTRGRPLRA